MRTLRPKMPDGHELPSVFSRVNISEPSDFGERRIRRLADGIGVTDDRGAAEVLSPHPPLRSGLEGWGLVAGSLSHARQLRAATTLVHQSWAVSGLDTPNRAGEG